MSKYSKNAPYFTISLKRFGEHALEPLGNERCYAPRDIPLVGCITTPLILSKLPHPPHV